MAAVGWQRFFVRDGKPRGLWRILLFVALAFVLFVLGGLLLTLLPPAARQTLLAPSLLLLMAALVPGWLLLVWLEDRPPAALGFARTSRVGRELAGGLLIGGGSLVLVVGALVIGGLIAYRSAEGTAGAYLAALGSHFVVLAVAAAAEEAIFRGYPFQVLVEGIGAVAATLLASAAFSLAHVFNPEVGALALLNIFLAGVLLSVAYLRTRSLWFATAVHLGWNWTMAAVLDLPVSGLVFFETPLYEPVLAGPDWITGGGFGPEGGIAATIAFGIALFGVLRLPGFDQAPELESARPLVNRRLGGWGRSTGDAAVGGYRDD